MPNLVSGVAQMVAGSSVRLPMDFGDTPQLIVGAAVTDGVLVLQNTITAFDVTCADVGAPVITNVALDYPYVLAADFTGGTARQTPYNVTFSITLDDGNNTTIVRVAPLQVL